MKEYKRVLVEELGSAAATPVATSEKDAKVLKINFGNDDVYSSEEHVQAEEVEEVLVEHTNLFLVEGLSLLEQIDDLSDVDFYEFLEESTYEDLEILETLYEVFLDTEVLNEGIFSGRQKKLLKRSRKEDISSLRKSASADRSRLKGTIKTAKGQYLKKGRAEREKELKSQSSQSLASARSLKKNDGESIADFSKRKAEAIRQAGELGSTAKGTAKKEAKQKFAEYKTKTKKAIKDSKDRQKLDVKDTKSGYKTAIKKDWEDTSFAGFTTKIAKGVGKGTAKVAGNVAKGAAKVAGNVAKGAAKVAGDVKKKIDDASDKAAREKARKEGEKQSKITLDMEAKTRKQLDDKAAKEKAEAEKVAAFEKNKTDQGINASFYSLSDEAKDILFESLTIQELSFLTESLNEAEMPSLEGLEYKEKFEVLLKHFGAEKISDLSDEDKKEFFNTLDSVHTSKDEMKSDGAEVQVSDKSAVLTLPKGKDKVEVSEKEEEALKEAFRVVRRVLSGSSLNEEESVEVPMDAEAEVKVEEDKIVIEIPVESPKEEISEEEAEELQEALDVINYILN
jgi:hypothetical protein